MPVTGAPSHSTSRPPPLAGVRVLDLSRLLPGPLCAQHLADLGAQVIKIEAPGNGDYARAAVRALVNRGKKGLTLDLKCDEGREVFFRLLAESDVVLDGFRPGTMERLGLGYEALARHRPAIVQCSITGYGQHGPRRDAAGHDINYLALTGVLDMTGRAGEAPVLPGFLLSDILGGTLCAAMGILAALIDSRSTGRGRFIDVSMADAVMAHCVLPLAEYHETGSVHPRGSGSHTGGAPRYNVYAARDGRHLAVGAQEKKFWDALCDAVEMPELKRHHQPDATQARQVQARLREAFARRDAHEWIERLQQVDCCVTPVLTFEQALADAGFAARGTVRPGRDPASMVFGLPFVLSELEVPADRPSPAPGADTVEILEHLGYPPDSIHAMRTRGVI